MGKKIITLTEFDEGMPGNDKAMLDEVLSNNSLANNTTEFEYLEFNDDDMDGLLKYEEQSSQKFDANARFKDITAE